MSMNVAVRRFASWLGTSWRVLLLVTITISSMVAFAALRGVDRRSHAVPGLLNDLRSEMYLQSSIEWQAIAEGGISSDARDGHGVSARRVTALIDGLANASPGGEVATSIRSVREYVAAINEELTLLDRGRVAEAREVDERRVDPAFEDAIADLTRAEAAADAAADRFDRLLLVVSIGTICIATAVSATLLVGLLRARRRALLAAARIDLLEEVSGQQERFAAMAAHELRTPLTGVIGSLEIVRRAATDPALRSHLGEVLDIGLNQARRLRRVCEDLEIAARPLESNVNLTSGPVPVRKSVEAAVRDLGEEGAGRVAVVVDDDVWAHADADRLVQVVANLIRNALQASPDGTLVRVSACRAEPWIEVQVEDRGCGIDPDRLESIFDRFGGGSASGGFGIGLAVVKHLVAAMGGEVTARSSPGTGSCFTVRLRAAPAPAPEWRRPRLADAAALLG